MNLNRRELLIGTAIAAVTGGTLGETLDYLRKSAARSSEVSAQPVPDHVEPNPDTARVFIPHEEDITFEAVSKRGYISAVDNDALQPYFLPVKFSDRREDLNKYLRGKVSPKSPVIVKIALPGDSVPYLVKRKGFDVRERLVEQTWLSAFLEEEDPITITLWEVGNVRTLTQHGSHSFLLSQRFSGGRIERFASWINPPEEIKP